MITDEKQLWNYLNKKYENDKIFQNEIAELVRFYGSKLVNLAETDEKKKIIFDVIEKCILGQYFHGYFLMNGLIEASQNLQEEIFHVEFWTIPKGMMLNQMSQVMELQFDREWAYHNGLNDFNLIVLKELPDGFDLYREIILETAIYGSYKAVIENELYKGSENNNEEGNLLLGDIYDIYFVNPQVFLQAQFYSEQHEIWDIFKTSNGKDDATWVGTIHLSTIPTDLEENQKQYIFSVSISDLIKLDEKSRILEQVCNKLPKEILSTMQLRMYHLSDLEVLIYDKYN